MTSSSRTRNLVVAGLLALLAAALTMFYVARAGGSPSARATAGTSASVLVAAHDLAVGTPVSAALAGGSIVVRRVPVEAIAPTAVASAAALRGQVVIQPIFKGEQLTAGRFGPSGAQGLRTSLVGALRAIAVPGDPTQLLASALKAGDHVDVVASVTRGDQPVARVALRDLLVLAPPPAPAAGSPTTTTSATLQLTDRQVQTLFWILKNGQWSFVLRPAAKATVTATAPATASTVLAGS